MATDRRLIYFKITEEAYLRLWESANPPKRAASRGLVQIGEESRYDSKYIQYKKLLVPYDIIDNRPKHIKATRRWAEWYRFAVSGAPRKHSAVRLTPDEVAEFMLLCRRHKVTIRSLGGLIGAYLEAVAVGQIKIVPMPYWTTKTRIQSEIERPEMAGSATDRQEQPH